MSSFKNLNKETNIIKSNDKWFNEKYDYELKIELYIIKYLTLNGKRFEPFSWRRKPIQEILLNMGYEE